ncbi:hypothetical protein [Xenorhabdus ishibashii]|uniref:Uncharacterized protein n=1 Tax=Xenorhabdus ishibashii TaxID=1034471 RepID=A0A2D0KC73_9GAMM|nr:hypothetical protein [Xenorhabdus ishibashii]PHM60952.1 hypothetical protein Xish_00058 [Xenorhabdus ishibashii]
MNKIKNPVVLVNIHENHADSLTVAVTDGSNDWRDMQLAIAANLDKPIGDDNQRLIDHVLFYTAQALVKSREENKKLKEVIRDICNDCGETECGHYNIRYTIDMDIITAACKLIEDMDKNDQ